LAEDGCFEDPFILVKASDIQAAINEENEIVESI
jgi:hypothetical protein